MTGDRPGVFVQFAARDPGTPDAPFLERCVRQAFDDVPGEVVIRVVDEAESAALNQRYRAKPGATNVLAFPPGEVPVDADEPVPLGDIVICAAVVTREAVAQRKTVAAHWAHLVIHACLHLQAYDHMTDDEAERMEDRERELLAGLGVADPYADEG